jgi:hypothetical protein
LPANCPSCKDSVQLLKKAVNSGNAEMMNAKTPSVTKSQPDVGKSNKDYSSVDIKKEKEVVEGRKEKAVPIVGIPPAQRPIKKEKPDLPIVSRNPLIFLILTVHDAISI